MYSPFIFSIKKLRYNYVRENVILFFTYSLKDEIFLCLLVLGQGL